MFQDRRAFHTGINSYVKGMQYSSSLISAAPSEFILGSPALASATAIATAVAANAVANTVVAQNYTSDARYGRSVNLAISGNPGNSHVVDVQGFDYLGQPMVERFTGASAVTAILYGKKCFYKVSATKIITASSNAVTFNLGTGTRLGLPFKGDVTWAKEGGLQVPVNKRDFFLSVDRSAAEAVSGATRFVRSPSPGFVKSLVGTPAGGGGATDPVVTVELGTVAITGLTVTVDTSSVVGLTVSDTPTTPGYNANNRFDANGLIEIVSAAAAGAFGDRVGVEITPTQVVMPDLTDPATAITGDPRGSYESLGVLDGLTEIRVGLVGDSQVNASDNGGLHGIKHYFA